MNITDVRKHEADGLILIDGHCQRFHTHRLCHSGIGMSGWNPAITDEVHKVGVRHVSCITLGVSEFSELEGCPE